MPTKLTMILAALSITTLTALGQHSESAVRAYNQGTTFYTRSEYTKAIPYLEQAIALDTNYTDAYDNLGTTFYAMGSYDSAAHYLEISLRKSPTGLAAIQNLAMVEEKRGNLPKAVEYFQRVTVIQPKNAEAYYEMARLLGTMGKTKESLSPALTAEKLFTAAKSPLLPQCHFLLFMIYYNLPDKPMVKKYRALCKKENVEIPALLALDPD
ncbi:MAG TPA: tetratricopeptide repeat protein [Puia sp.]|nr:tetratricopeptide repeat protein [Puia sp.]